MDLLFYIHWPFCESICPYCDFNSFVKNDINHNEMLNCYISEIDFYKNKVVAGYRVKSIFFGGGTPSLMMPDNVGKIIEKIKSSFLCDENIEITLEANPSSIEMAKMLDFKLAGINRISTGIQALNDHDLKMLGRRHSKKEAVNAMNLIPQIYNNYSFDFIYARPNQDTKLWENELNDVIKVFDIKHISAYSLAIEKGTDFFTSFKKGKISIPEQTLQELFYSITREVLNQNNIKQYEVSNYAIKNHECVHNLGYWQLKDYIGVGPGAHGRVTLNDGIRYETMCHHKPEKWTSSIQKNFHGLQKCKPISTSDQINEIFIMGLRSYNGIDINYIKSKFSIDIMSIVNKLNLEKLINESLLIIKDQKIIPTESGICVVNSIAKFLLC